MTELPSSNVLPFQIRLEEIDNFIQHEHKVCKYASKSKKLYQAIPEKDIPELIDIFQNYLNEKESKTLILVFNKNHENYPEAARETEKVIAEHAVAMNILFQQSYSRPYFFIFYMGPLYTQNHPRHCPHSILLFNLESDFNKVPDKIRNEILNRAINNIYQLEENGLTPKDFAKLLNYPLDIQDSESQFNFYRYALELVGYQEFDFLLPEPPET